MTDAIRDNNHVTVALGVSSTDSTVTTPFKVDPSTGRLLTDASASGYTNLTQFVDQTPWRIFYSNVDGDVVELAFGSAGTYLQSNGASSAPTWATPAGSGDVTAASNFGTDNVLIRSDGVAKGVQATGISVADTTNDITGAGNYGGTGATLSGLTASEIVITDASKNLTSAAVATYPSLTELTYVKGVTSAIQTQLNAKQATITFGTGVETALGVNVGTAGSIVVNGGALGTPSSGTVTNLTGTASININGTVGATTPTTGAFTTGAFSTSATVTTSDTSTTPRLAVIQNSTGDAAMRFALSTTRSYAFGIDNSASDSLIISTAATGSAVLGTGNLFTLTTAGALTIAAGFTASGASSIGTSNAFTTGTIELGAASDTTLSRSSAGVLAVEGVVIPSISSTNTLTNKTYQAPLIDFVVEPATDDTYEGTATNDINAGATIAQWEAVYLDSTPDWNLTDASAAATAGGVMIALATEAGTATNPVNVLLHGIARNDGWTWTAGGPIYLSETAGALTQTAPTTASSVTRVVGYALSDDAIYWNPSNDWVVHA